MAHFDAQLLRGRAFSVGLGPAPCVWRVVARAHSGVSWYFFNVTSENRKTLPTIIEIADIEALYNFGLLRFLSTEEDDARPGIDTLSPKSRARYDKTWGVVSLVIADEQRFLDARTRGAFLVEVCEATGCKEGTLRTWLDQFYRRGAEPSAMIPGFPNCGTHPSRGSPRSADYVISAADETIIEDETAKLLSTARNRPTARSTVTKVNKAHSTVTERSAGGIAKAVVVTSDAKAHQVATRIRRRKKTPKDRSKQLSDTQMRLQHRSRVESAADRAAAPDDSWEVDCLHTSELKLLHPWGWDVEMERLRLWVAIDVCTGDPVEVFPSFRAESVEMLKAALFHFIAPQANDRWDPFLPIPRQLHRRIPRVIRLDGIAMPYATDEIPRLLPVRLEVVQAQAGDEKPFVEGFNSWIREFIVKGRDGALLQEEADRGILRSVPSYCLDDFMIDLYCGIENFRSGPIDEKQLAPGLRPFLRDHPTRPGYRETALRYAGTVARYADFDQVARTLLKCVPAKVTTNGLNVENMHFTCPTAEREGWFTRGLGGVERMQSVLRDPLAMGRRWIDLGPDKPLELLTPIGSDADFAELDETEYAALNPQRRRRKAATKKRQRVADVLYSHQQDDFQKRARGRVREQKKILADAQARESSVTQEQTRPEMSARERRILERILRLQQSQRNE